VLPTGHKESSALTWVPLIMSKELLLWDAGWTCSLAAARFACFQPARCMYLAFSRVRLAASEGFLQVSNLRPVSRRQLLAIVVNLCGGCFVRSRCGPFRTSACTNHSCRGRPILSLDMSRRCLFGFLVKNCFHAQPLSSRILPLFRHTWQLV
jgi:hypothetical protein